MSVEENKELIRSNWRNWERVGVDAAKIRSLYTKVYAPGTVFHNLSSGDATLEQRMSSMMPFFTAFPGSKFDIDDILAEGDKVVIRYTWKATHSGSFMGIPASGKQIAVKGFEIDRIEAGKITEVWELLDSQGLMQQIGVIPKT